MPGALTQYAGAPPAGTDEYYNWVSNQIKNMYGDPVTNKYGTPFDANGYAVDYNPRATSSQFAPGDPRLIGTEGFGVTGPAPQSAAPQVDAQPKTQQQPQSSNVISPAAQTGSMDNWDYASATGSAPQGQQSPQQADSSQPVWAIAGIPVQPGEDVQSYMARTHQSGALQGFNYGQMVPTLGAQAQGDAPAGQLVGTQMTNSDPNDPNQTDDQWLRAWTGQMSGIGPSMTKSAHQIRSDFLFYNGLTPDQKLKVQNAYVTANQSRMPDFIKSGTLAPELNELDIARKMFGGGEGNPNPPPPPPPPPPPTSGTRNWGANPDLNKHLASSLGYNGDFTGGQFQGWLSTQPSVIQDQYQSIMRGEGNPNPPPPPPPPPPSGTRNWGNNILLNKKLAEQLGYNGDFTGGQFQGWLSTQPADVQTKYRLIMGEGAGKPTDPTNPSNPFFPAFPKPPIKPPPPSGGLPVYRRPVYNGVTPPSTPAPDPRGARSRYALPTGPLTSAGNVANNPGWDWRNETLSDYLTRVGKARATT